MRTIIVVGGSKGIGKKITEVFLENNTRVLVICRTQVKNSKANIFTMDINDKDEVAKGMGDIFKKYKSIDGLVFCQRYRGSDDAWDGEMRTSLTATNVIIEEYVKHQKKNASVVLIGSIATDFVADEQPASYHVAKGGMQQLMRYYAAKVGHKNIRFNMVSPGAVIKDRNAKYFRDNKSVTMMFKKIVPLGRLGKDKEIANVVRFLLSPEASYVTGQNIYVDGGLTTRWQESVVQSAIKK